MWWALTPCDCHSRVPRPLLSPFLPNPDRAPGFRQSSPYTGSYLCPWLWTCEGAGASLTAVIFSVWTHRAF